MNLLARTASVVIAIAAVLTFYTALLHLTRRNIKRSYSFRIARDLAVGTQTLQLYFLTKELQLQYPFLLFPFVTLLFLSGPLNYIRYFKFFYPEEKIPLRLKVQLVPASIVLIGETWFYFFNPSDSQAVIQSVFNNPAHHFVTYIIIAGVIVSLIQYILLLRLEIGFVRRKQTREPVLVSSTLMLFFMVDILLIAVGFLITNRDVMNLGILLIGIAGIIYLLFENRYPDFYQLVAREQRQEKYKKSIIQGLSREKIIARLRELMEEEKIYRQFDLKLEDVAAMLLITPHQLSEFVNDCIGMNFSSYINQYRVGEAKELLISQLEENTLTIAFQVGFGSKQSFNMIFKQQTGMTPSGYRKQAQNEPNSQNL
ncbi:MAG TPA: helix-turn-helix domain-containing protein [Anaerolineales bacterium]|nr:helix-turn-helix domain-containing protein [Anaerolineales bacterium]